MEISETIEHSARKTEGLLAPQAGCGCQSNTLPDCRCQNMPPGYVYALGRVNARFPRVSLEKEFAQVARRSDTNGYTDTKMFESVLSQRENRYLARQLCWVFTIQGIDTYLLQPRDSADLDLLLGALRPESNPLAVDAVIGLLGPIAGPDICNGLMIPIVAFDQIYSFDRDELIAAIPRSEKTMAEGFDSSAKEVFERIMQMTDNAGSTDEHRALNYSVVRYPAVYSTVAEAHMRNASLTSVDVVTSRLSGTRKIVDIILSLTNRNNEFIEKFFTRVDVTEEFPFLVTQMSPYYDR